MVALAVAPKSDMIIIICQHRLNTYTPYHTIHICQSLMEGLLALLFFSLMTCMQKTRGLLVRGAEGRMLSLQKLHLPENATLSQIF